MLKSADLRVHTQDVQVKQAGHTGVACHGCGREKPCDIGPTSAELQGARGVPGLAPGMLLHWRFHPMGRTGKPETQLCPQCAGMTTVWLATCV